jgi:hypothetical protein
MASVPLIAAGGGVQVAGFGLTLAQSVRTRREQSPDEASLARWACAWSQRTSARAATWVRVKTEPLLVRLRFRRPYSASGRISSSLGLEGRLKGHKSTRRPDLSFEERVAGLEDDVDELRRRQIENSAHLEGRIEELRGDIESQRAAQESERAKQLGRSLRYEELGIGVFVVGVALTTIGSVV